MQDKVKDALTDKPVRVFSGPRVPKWLQDAPMPQWGKTTPEDIERMEEEKRQAAREKRIRELEAKAERLEQEAKEAIDPRYNPTRYDL